MHVSCLGNLECTCRVFFYNVKTDYILMNVTSGSVPSLSFYSCRSKDSFADLEACWSWSTGRILQTSRELFWLTVMICIYFFLRAWAHALQHLQAKMRDPENFQAYALWIGLPLIMQMTRHQYTNMTKLCVALWSLMKNKQTRKAGKKYDCLPEILWE